MKTIAFEIVICKMSAILFWPQRAYHQTSNMSRTLVGNTMVDHSNVVGASPVGAAPSTPSFWT